jgi:uncharacterized integral membrane protein
MSTPAEQPPPGEVKPSSDGREARKRSSRELVRTGSMVGLAVLATLFAVLNSNEVKVKWIIGSGRAPLIVVIVISLLAGIVLAHLAERFRRRRR